MLMDGLPSFAVFDDAVSLPFGSGISVAFEADVSTSDEDMVEQLDDQESE